VTHAGCSKIRVRIGRSSGKSQLAQHCRLQEALRRGAFSSRSPKPSRTCRTPSRAGRLDDRGAGSPRGLQKIVAARRSGRDNVGCIILERGENDQKVREWLTTAATVEGFIGFAVGRTSFWDPLVNMRAKKITREAAAFEIARRYQEFVDIFEKARTSGLAEVS